MEEKYFYLVWEPLNGGPGYGNTASPQNDSLANFLSNFTNATITAYVGWLSSKYYTPPTGSDYTQHRAALDVAASAGRKMLLVAHSQGNLFVNVAYDYIQPIASSARVKVVHIAPASTSLTGPWTLANIDLIINALRLDGGLGSVPDNNLFTTPSTPDKSGPSWSSRMPPRSRSTAFRDELEEGLVEEGRDFVAELLQERAVGTDGRGRIVHRRSRLEQGRPIRQPNVTPAGPKSPRSRVPQHTARHASMMRM